MSTDAATTSRTRLQREVWLVLGLSLGQAAVYSVVSLVAKLTEPGGLSKQTASVVSSVTTRSVLDLTYQLLGITFALVPVLLALHFLSLRVDGSAAGLRVGAARIGLLPRAGPAGRTDVAWGAALAALIGLPGLGLYFAARALGLNATVLPSTLYEHWWTVPVLVLAAWQNAVLEEAVVVGYLVTRLRELGWSSAAAVGASALLRGSYHLYQGFGAFLGNAVMGVIFGGWFLRRRTVLPLVVAHGLIDTVAFVGYALLKGPLGLP